MSKSTPFDWQDRTLASLRRSLNPIVSSERATSLGAPLIEHLIRQNVSDEEIAVVGIFLTMFGLQGKAPGSL